MVNNLNNIQGGQRVTKPNVYATLRFRNVCNVATLSNFVATLQICNVIYLHFSATLQKTCNVTKTAKVNVYATLKFRNFASRD